jgi:hypothetical protein
MAARLPKLSEEALRRIAEASRAEGLTPDAYILKFVPAVSKKARKALSEEEASKLAVEAVREHRASRVYQKQVRLKAESMTVAEAEALFSQRIGGVSEREAGQIADKALVMVRGRRK